MGLRKCGRRRGSFDSMNAVRAVVRRQSRRGERGLKLLQRGEPSCNNTVGM